VKRNPTAQACQPFDDVKRKTTAQAYQPFDALKETQQHRHISLSML
jgi:hypothetical protein